MPTPSTRYLPFSRGNRGIKQLPREGVWIKVGNAHAIEWEHECIGSLEWRIIFYFTILSTVAKQPSLFNYRGSLHTLHIPLSGSNSFSIKCNNKLALLLNLKYFFLFKKWPSFLHLYFKDTQGCQQDRHPPSCRIAKFLLFAQIYFIFFKYFDWIWQHGNITEVIRRTLWLKL